MLLSRLERLYLIRLTGVGLNLALTTTKASAPSVKVRGDDLSKKYSPWGATALILVECSANSLLIRLLCPLTESVTDPLWKYLQQTFTPKP